MQNNLGNLYLLSNAKSRSISPENFTGEKGKGGMAKVGEGSASNAARELDRVGNLTHILKFPKVRPLLWQRSMVRDPLNIYG